jgi:hypothetical protein
VKTVKQQAIGTLHRVRSAWMSERTAKINTLRDMHRFPSVVTWRATSG